MRKIRLPKKPPSSWPEGVDIKDVLTNLNDIDPEKLKELVKIVEGMTKEEMESFKNFIMSGNDDFMLNNPFAPVPVPGSGRNVMYLLAWLLPILLILIYLAFKLYNSIKRRQIKKADKKKKEAQGKNTGKKKII
ncbi:uncharacterized protein LOC142323609 isoform X1 [Lycorma delicatula]|uniref:uncharacterized protein LOC142323609 isoform X1 n=1 Tax=Lycorma delicatula TaxID=130591 RepID=UPI003F517FBA